MKLKPVLLLLSLKLLASCTSPTEQQGSDAVAQFYGGSVSYSKGSHLSTNASEPQGKYLEMSLTNAALTRNYKDLKLPASNCAYLVYSHLAPAEQHAYDYLKVNLQDSVATHSFTFQFAELQAATQAASQLAAVMAQLQKRDYPAVAGYFNPVALGTLSPDSLPHLVAKIGQRVGPITTYALQGYDLMAAPVAGQPQQFVRLFVAVVAQPEPAAKLLVVVNPRLRANEKFLYGLNILN